MKEFKTPKGTTLPLLDMSGKPYLQVAHRILWFREDHPDWAIETEYIDHGQDHSWAKATIRDATGRILSTAHKFEDKQGFGDHREKSETGAIGRAMALVGYGTQFCAHDMDEGDRIVDSPVRVTKNVTVPFVADPGFTVTRKTKYSGDVGPTSPLPANPVVHAPSNPGSFVITFGKKYKDRRIDSIDIDELRNYISYLEESADREGKPLHASAQALVDHAVAHINSVENSDLPF